MFNVVHANHIEDLRDLALGLMARYPLAPLEKETFLVQSSGMGQWLQLAIAEQQGIAASLEFTLPAAFVWQAFRSVLGDSVPVESPFDRRALAWRLMAILPDVLDEPAYVPLRDYLYREVDQDGEPSAYHCFQLADRLAALYDQYLVYRPDWIDAWGEGREPEDLKLTADQQWQPRLWREILARTAPEQRHLHRAYLQREFLDRLNDMDALPTGFPRRLFVFGISSLPLALIEALHALSRHMDVILLVNNPSRFYWGDIVSEREALWRIERPRPPLPQKQALHGLDPVSLHLSTNPLLSSWGAQGRDFIQALYGFEQSLPFDTEADIFIDPAKNESATLLQQLQQEVLDLVHPAERVKEEGHKRILAAGDDSLRLIACHSALREVEVLYDTLLDAFERTPDLKPRDIIVQVPDIDRYTPFIEAVFARYEPADPRYIPFSIADQKASQASPLLATALELLAAPEQRLTVSEVIDWLDIPAFRRRFGLSENDMTLLTQWIEQSGIRWGISGEQRARLDLPALELNTWRFGLKRMMLGYAMGDMLPSPDTRLSDIEPFDEVQGLDAALIGHLIDMIDQLTVWCDTLAEPCDPAAWELRINQLLEDFFDPQEVDEFDVLTRLSNAVATWLASCESAEFSRPLPLDVVRTAVTDYLDEGGLSPRFLAGRVNFATLMPMRAIPFRHVYLLGMNDGEYPRARMAQDFDLMAEHPRSGDRSRRDDDRYLMLEALLAAREQLTISWIGFEQRSNQPRPYSILVSELLDAVAKGWQVPVKPDRAPMSDQQSSTKGSDESDEKEGDKVENSEEENRRRLDQRLIQYHPLQPFSRRYFSAAGVSSDGERTQVYSWPALYSYDEQWRVQRTLALPEPVQETLPTTIALQSLVTLLRQPADVCLQTHFGIFYTQPDEVLEETEPFALKGIDRYQLKRELLDGLLAGISLDESRQHLVRAGRLPALGFGDAVMDEQLNILTTQWELWDNAVRWLTPLPERTLQWQSEGLLVEERLGGSYQTAEGLALWRLEAGAYGDIKCDKSGRLIKPGKPHRLLRLYCEQLLWASAQNEPVTAHAVFEDRILHFPLVTPEDAQSLMNHYLRLWKTAWQAPYPAILALSLAYAGMVGAEEEQADAERSDVRPALRAAYEEGDFFNPALRDAQPVLRDLWPDYTALEEAGFVTASDILYGAFYQTLQGIAQGKVR
ncbi:RecBCD enzyme subunit RecC [Halomonadaceae bacterium LMG 33818]|uniref:exodeoxyribonuclease V subunit gamma n=1 Tax=Cernens ardua TaxID=3402176 RepID=UPI003EDCA54A